MSGKTVRECVRDYVRAQIADPSSGKIWVHDSPLSLAFFRDMAANFAHEERCPPISVNYGWDAVRNRATLVMDLVGGARLSFRLNPEKQYADVLDGDAKAGFEQGFSNGVREAARMIKDDQRLAAVGPVDMANVLLQFVRAWEEAEGVVVVELVPKAWKEIP